MDGGAHRNDLIVSTIFDRTSIGRAPVFPASDDVLQTPGFDPAIAYFLAFRREAWPANSKNQWPDRGSMAA
jgi:hypothetical protein